MQGNNVFIDSNVLLYARDVELSAKAGISNAWLRETVWRGVACANLQVLNEVTQVMLRKRRDLTQDEVFAAVDELSFLGSSPITMSSVHAARKIRSETLYSWWDCLLLACALELGCKYFLSEDLQDGQDIEGLTIVNPFAHSPDQIPISR